MASQRGGIDYSKWDNLESSDEEEGEEHPPSSLMVPQKPLPKPGELVSLSSILKEGTIECTGDLEGLTVVPDDRDGCTSVLLKDPSKVFRRADGTLVYGDLNGEHVGIRLGGSDRIPSSLLPNQGPRCFHGSSRENFLSTSELQQAIEELVNKTIDEATSTSLALM